MNKEDIRATDITSMGRDLGEVYAELWQEVSRLHGKWEEYDELFGTKESRIALMNEAAPDFFGKLQNSQWREVLLDLACLTDRPKVMGRENLTVQSLPALIEDLVLKQHVTDLVANVLEKSAFARDWRNRYLAHRDKALALGRAEPLTPVSRAETKAALDSLGAVLDAVSHHYQKSTTAWSVPAGGYGGVLALLYVIDDGVRAEQERRQRLESGNVLLGDYNRDV